MSLHANRLIGAKIYRWAIVQELEDETIVCIHLLDEDNIQHKLEVAVQKDDLILDLK